MPFKVAPCVAEDMDRAFAVFSETFEHVHPFVDYMFPHHDTPTGRRIGAERFRSTVTNSPISIYVKATDVDTGVIAGIAQWGLYDGLIPNETDLEGDYWDSEDDKDLAKDISRNYVELRRKAIVDSGGHLVCALAGITVDFSLYPLDTLKTRLQSNLTSTSQNASLLPRHTLNGTLRSMYAGLPSALLGSMPSAASFFVVYDTLKRRLITRDTSPTATAYAHMLASSAGEVAACAIRVPTEVVKQRAQAGLFGGKALPALQDILRLRSSHGFTTMVRELYRGAGVTVMREIPFTIVQFTLWERFKVMHMRRQNQQQGGEAEFRRETKISAVASAGWGSLAGAVAAGCTTPLDVLKTRIMLERRETGGAKRRGALGLLRQIVNEEGAKGLFRGFVPRVGWISTGGAIFLGTYQWAWNNLGGEDDGRDEVAVAPL